MGQIDLDGSNSTLKADVIRGQASTTVKLGGLLDTDGNYIQTEKGGDLTSASPLVVDTDGDYFDVTGTTNFTAMTVAADRQFTLQFDGVLTMTHHATNLDLPGEANITTAAGDVATFQSTGSNTVQCISYTKADGTGVVSAGGGWVELQSITASDTATVDLETDIGSTYNEYMVKVSSAIPANDDVLLLIRLKVGGSYVTANYRQHIAVGASSSTNYAGNVTQTAAMYGAYTLGIASGESADLTLHFANPDGTSEFKKMYQYGVCEDINDYTKMLFGVGSYTGGTGALTGIRFYMGTGNIASGIFTLYGLTKA